ncbi:hypothetical protein D3C86_1691010 [compost metagenome]
MPGAPFGILAKLSRPICLAPWKSKGQWSVATVWMVPAAIACQSASLSLGLRKGGLMTYLAPSKSGAS